MRTSLSAAALVISICVLVAQQPQGARDAILSAMHDEVQRSLSLTLSGADKPYFVEYHVDDGESVRMLASAGGMVFRSRSPFRSYSQHVRVGSYQLDNSNYQGRISGTALYGLTGCPLDAASSPPTYDVMRRYLWLATDRSYKVSVDVQARKRARLNNSNANETLDDFARAAAVTEIAPPRRLEMTKMPGRNGWCRSPRSPTSSPKLESSTITFSTNAGAFYLVNTEGSELRTPVAEALLRVWMVARAPDGMRLRDSCTFLAPDLASMPSEAEMIDEGRRPDRLLRSRSARITLLMIGCLLSLGIGILAVFYIMLTDADRPFRQLSV